MYFKQFYLGCLAHASYLIASEGEAVVVDPQRDVDQYVEEAERQGARIRYVLETHLHADFVSGHRELADRTGAEIVFGTAAGAEFPHRAVGDGEELRVGRVRLRTIETPGHTPESVCWLVSEEGTSEPAKLLTGDTLFIGDVGRPDLAGGRGYTSDQMASMLYDSLRRILALGDEVEVWPAHGAGSACGKNISRDRSSTVGLQRRTNYALQPMSREEFVSMMTADLPPAPRYFPVDAEINRRGARPLHEVAARPLAPADAAGEVARGAVVLDVRDGTSYGVAHVPGAINIGLDGQYASWAGTLLKGNERLLIVSSSREAADEAVMRLARVGLENVVGFVDGGIAAWEAAGLPLASLEQITAADLHPRLREVGVIDVRRPAEHESGHIPGAVNVPLADIDEALEKIDRSRPLAIVCAGGYRSSIAASILLRHDYDVRYNVVGGTGAWVAAGFDLER